MKLYRLDARSLDTLKMVEEPTPVPGPGEVLVRIRAVSLNFKDLAFVTPAEGVSPSLPCPIVPLSDAAGEVAAIGSGVTRVAMGDRVTNIAVQGWLDGSIPPDALDHALGYGIDGVLSEYRLFDEQALLKLPGSYDFREGSTLTIAGVTAWNALKDVRAGQSVLVLGTGGVALFALQFAKIMGALVIVTTSSAEKRHRLEGYRVDHVLDRRRYPEWDQEVLRLTGGRGVDHVVENVGGASIQMSGRAAAIGGTIQVVGANKGTVDVYPLMYKALEIRGVRVGSRHQFEEMMVFIDRHGVKPVIDTAFPFEQAVAAYDHLKSAQHFGKIVIDIS
jgi:NADPH:quinone reductase-like Zn-dependent oxidoreductase